MGEGYFEEEGVVVDPTIDDGADVVDVSLDEVSGVSSADFGGSFEVDEEFGFVDCGRLRDCGIVAEIGFAEGFGCEAHFEDVVVEVEFGGREADSVDADGASAVFCLMIVYFFGIFVAFFNSKNITVVDVE